MTARDFIKLNDHIHGELNRGARGYYPLPKTGRSYDAIKGSQSRRSLEESVTNYERLQTAKQILASFES